MRYLNLLLIIFFCSFGWADKHTDLAGRMVDFTLEQDYSGRVSSLIANLNRVIPGANIQEEEVLELVKKVYTSPEYKAAKVEAYKQNYTAEELEQVLKLIQEPAYKLLLSKQQAVTQASAEVLTPILQKEMQVFIESRMTQ
jgi:hypothetical protein